MDRFLWELLRVINALLWVGFMIHGILGEIHIIDLSYEEITRNFAVTACCGLASFVQYPDQTKPYLP